MDNSKGGFRLLWTQEGERIVVWFIAKHKVYEEEEVIYIDIITISLELYLI